MFRLIIDDNINTKCPGLKFEIIASTACLLVLGGGAGLTWYLTGHSDDTPLLTPSTTNTSDTGPAGGIANHTLD